MSTEPDYNKTEDEDSERPELHTGDHDHTVKPGEELIYAQKYGMAWNPADHERLGMSDFERDYGQEPLDTSQEYRVAGKPEMEEEKAENEAFDPLAEEGDNDAVSQTE
jgi:hypothetical protein